MLRCIVRALLKLLFRVETHGFEHYAQTGKRLVVIANHQSFLDAALLAVFLPRRPSFAINSFIAELWWVKLFLPLARTVSIDPTNPLATKKLIEEVKREHPLAIFPEGRITVTGGLMKVYEGPGMIADKAGAELIPVRIEGAQFSLFSRLRGKVKRQFFPKITLTMLPPVRLQVPEELKGRKRRTAIGRQLYAVMSRMVYETAPTGQTLFDALIEARNRYGRKQPVVVDVLRKPLTYKQLMIRSFVLGRRLARDTEKGDYVGLLLPNMAVTIVSFFGLQAFGRIPAMLNFSTGPKNIVSACKTAEIKRVYTARSFVEKGRLQPLIEAMEQAGVTIGYLEDIAPSVRLPHKLRGVWDALFPACAYHAHRPSPEDAAVVLFTSGSEGTPKGVVLSHANLMANCYQMKSRIDFGPRDTVFNALPVFHSFGLTGGTLLPLFSGCRTFFYPSPLHYRVVPELIYDSNATIVFGTDTFLAGYARFAHAYDFYNTRYVFAGAEKLKDETRRLYAEKYGVRIFEGYGATETSPVLSCNTPMHNRAGTVGQLIPGLEHRLEKVPGIDEGGRLYVRGPNVMKGYLLAANPGVLVPPEDGWYDTGDIVTIDEEGFVRIQGRAKRFAKVGGEMVSLAAVEQWATELWPDAVLAVMAVPDAKKGEQLVLVTEYGQAKREALQAYAREQGIGELSVPKSVKIVDKLPLLGTGKVDYVSLKEMLNEEA